MIRQHRLTETAPGSVPAVLADISHELSSIQDWRERVRDSLSLLCDLLPTSMVLLGLETDRWEFFSCRELSHDLEELKELLLQHYRILTGDEAPSIYARVTTEDGVRTGLRELDSATACFLSMPVVGADRVVGILHIRSDEPDAYSIDDVSLVSVVASQIGSYLMNVMAFENEQRARHEIERLQLESQSHLHILQQALVPSRPTIGGDYEVASEYIPGFKGHEIGGDFFDVFETEEGKICVFIGDVSGKGIPAASMAAATRSTVRAFAYELSSAGQVLTHSNAVISRYQSGYGLFVTVFLVILDPATGRICYCGAGHPPAALYSGGGVGLLTFGHPPFGTIDRFEYGEDGSLLRAGDRLILYTDGISEARRGHDLFGTERVVDVVSQHGDSSPGDLVARLVAEATDFAGGRLTDDAAIVVLGRR